MQFPRAIGGLLFFLAAFSRLAVSQSAADFPPPPSPAEIRATLETLDTGTATAAADLYRDALARLEKAEAARSRAAIAREEVSNAPTRLAAVRDELSRPASIPRPDAPTDATIAQLEQAEAESIAGLAQARARAADLQAESTRRQERRSMIPEALAAARQRLAEVETALRTPSPTSDDPVLSTARNTARLAEREQLSTEIEALELELASYDARRDLLPARRDLEARHVAESEALVDAWRAVVAARRQQDANQTARNAERLSRTAARQHPALLAFASETEQLAELRTAANAVPQEISATNQRAITARAEFTNLRQRYISMRQRVEVSGLNRATGLLLRREFESLPERNTLARELKATQRELADTQYLLLERRDARVGSDDINAVAEGLLQSVGNGDATSDEMRSVAIELAAARRDILAQLETDADRYQSALVELDFILRRLLIGTTEYEDLIRERILWVRSIPATREHPFDDLAETARWLVNPVEWTRSLTITLDAISRQIPVTVLLAALAIGSAFAARRAKSTLRRTADLVGRYRTDAFVHTFRALICTLIVAAPTPLMCWLIGFALKVPAEQTPLAVAAGFGLQGSAFLLFPLRALRVMLMRNGLGDIHFRWPEPARLAIRRQIAWFTPVFIPATAITITMDHTAGEAAAASVGRLAFMVSMVAVALLTYRLCRPRGPLASAVLADKPDGWFERLRYIWYPLLVALPIALCTVAWLGYFYTALQLQLRIEHTIVLMLGLLVMNGLLLRWLFIARRRVAVEDARRRREQAVAETSTNAASEGLPSEASIPALDEEKVNLPGISSQSRQLFTALIWTVAITGLYVIWGDALPALRLLDRIEVYPAARIVESSVDDSIPVFESTSAPLAIAETQQPNPTASEQPASANPAIGLPGFPSAQARPDTDVSEDVPVTISLADIGLAIVVLVATALAFRNLPGLIEIVVLQRLPLDSGSRFALSTVIRYAIAIIGIIAAFSAVNIAWANVQWLAAALTFGLAFGLQEIFANFISGLIILAERPIRIGDTVTVGSVSGSVSRIRMRATTITDWDRKELIIPNKTFITGDVINWTLSDALLRLTIPVGVSYGADVRLAEQLLLKAAIDEPNVMKDPKPYVLFNAFGDSTLDFQLRVFIPNIDHIISVRHNLNFRIIEVFRANGIEIAFPQRDIHVRSIGDLAGLVEQHRPDGQSGNSPAASRPGISPPSAR